MKQKKIVLITFVSIPALLIIGLFGILAKDKLTPTNYFEIAAQRQNEYKPKRKDLVIVVDYRKSILSERLYVLDMINKKVLLSSKVSHAWNSGVLYPNNYSNANGSEKTSKGNYITLEPYQGGYGYSMKVAGQDPGINSNAKDRLVVFHSDKKMKRWWSKGCFATPEEANKKIIDMTKNGVLVCVID
jgi:hypothetical protein